MVLPCAEKISLKFIFMLDKIEDFDRSIPGTRVDTCCIPDKVYLQIVTHVKI